MKESEKGAGWFVGFGGNKVSSGFLLFVKSAGGRI